jgi:hypothetical protein
VGRKSRADHGFGAPAVAIGERWRALRFLAAATIAAITGGVVNAWLFLVRLGD